MTIIVRGIHLANLLYNYHKMERYYVCVWLYEKKPSQFTQCVIEFE